MHLGSPRQYSSYPTGLPGTGLPRDRDARLAERRAFVDLKQRFMEAMAGLDDEHVEWIRRQIRLAEHPEDLLLLRGQVFACLAGPDPMRGAWRRTLRRGLDSVFPDSAPRSGFVSF